MTRIRMMPLLLAIALPTLAQQARVSETVEVDLVEVPVTVLDRAGNPVRGLTAANFELIDEGQKRPIAYFEEIDLATAAADDAEPVSPVAHRNFMILFDLSNSSPANVVRAREAANEFVTNQVRDADRIAVGTFSVESGFRLITTFTTDRELVRDAVNTLGNPRFFAHSDPLFLAASIRAAPDSAEDGGAGRGPGAGIGEELMAAMEEQAGDFARMTGRDQQEFERGRITRQLRNFGGFAKALDSVPGRKQVILLTEGFDARLIQGRDSASSAETQEESAAVVFGESWKIDTDKRYGSTTGMNEVNEMAELFRRSDVVLHAMDIQGLRAAGERAARSGASTESLFLITNPTGGEVFKNANDLNTNFQKLLRQQEVIYVLGFHAPATGNPGKFHELRVRLKEVPGRARVSHRSGYYEPSATVSPIENVLSASSILLSGATTGDFAVETLAVPFPGERGAAKVPVIVEIPAPRFLMAAGSESVAANLYIYAFDRGNRVGDFLHQPISARGGDASGRGIKYYGSLLLPPGDYELRTLVRFAGSESFGFHLAPLTVPDFDDHAVLRPFIFDDEGDWQMLKGRPRSAAEVDYPFELAGESFIPSAIPHLREGSSRKVALFTYNFPEDGMEIDARVRAVGGEERSAAIALVGRTQKDEKGATKLLFEFTPRGLAPGRYELEIRVRDRENGAARSGATRFVVE